MKRQAKQILPTMKVETDPKNNLDIEFRECQAVITGCRDQATQNYGIKTIMTLRASDNDEEFNVFVNNFSMQNLIDAFGDEDSKWTGKTIQLVKEEDPQYHNEMIVIKAI